MTFIVGVIKHL